MTIVPTEVEAMAGLPLGLHAPGVRLPAPTGSGPLEALLRAVEPALRRPPCLVSFSGGRDSSAVLAVAVHAARRAGLPDPVPATLRFPAAPASDERAWQELVVSHLGLREWLRVDLGQELDALGDIAVATLRAHGLRWPANAFMHQPLLDRAEGGSLLTGAGGDELLDTRGARLWLLLRRRERPQARDALRVARDLAPRALRAAAWQRREAPDLPWLTPAGRAVVTRAAARDAAAWPGRWDATVRFWPRTRGFAALDDAVPALGRRAGVLVRNPLLDPAVLAEMADAGGPAGFAGRTEAMRLLFGDLLPDAVLARQDKAVFSAALWGPRARAFAERWRGEGVDPRLVDVERLRAVWRSPEPVFGTSLLLHRAWLHVEASG